jgi:hypothetical protein
MLKIKSFIFYIVNIEMKNSSKEVSEETKKKYNERIAAIQNYYDISNIAAVYMYFRRKRSYPWKKKSDPKYLYWNAKLQNALILADSIFGFDWESMEYGKEEETLQNYGIDIKSQSNNLFREKDQPSASYIDDDGNEWQVVSKKKNNIVNSDVDLLQSIGLLPKK